MSSHSSAPPQRRTSQRRRLKILNKTNEYRVSNPFRQQHAPPFPNSLLHQLKRIEFLSASAIAQLCFESPSPDGDCGEGMLSRMHEAVLLQQLRISTLLSPTCPPCPQEAVDEEEAGKAEVEGEEVVQTKDEISRNIYDVRDPRRQQDFVGELLVGEESKGGAGTGQPQGGLLVCEQQYQNYFAN